MAPNDRQFVGQNSLQDQANMSGQIWEARQDARGQIADQFETIDNPDDVALESADGGTAFGPAEGFLEWAVPQETAHALDPMFPEHDIGPADIDQYGDSYGLAEDTQREIAADRFADSTALASVDPWEDVVVERAGDGLEASLTPGAEERAGEVVSQKVRRRHRRAARQDVIADLEAEYGVEVNSSDVTIDLQTGEATLSQSLERRIEDVEQQRRQRQNNPLPGMSPTPVIDEVEDQQRGGTDPLPGMSDTPVIDEAQEQQPDAKDVGGRRSFNSGW